MVDFPAAPADGTAEATAAVVVEPFGGAEVATLDATLLVVVIDEAVADAVVIVCCCCCWGTNGTTADEVVVGGGGGGWDAVGAVVTGPAVEGGVAVVMVEFWLERQIPVTWRGVFNGVLQHRGERTHLLSALRG